MRSRRAARSTSRSRKMGLVVRQRLQRQHKLRLHRELVQVY
jgi:hypothetical protein